MVVFLVAVSSILYAIFGYNKLSNDLVVMSPSYMGISQAAATTNSTTTTNSATSALGKVTLEAYTVHLFDTVANTTTTNSTTTNTTTNTTTTTANTTTSSSVFNYTKTMTSEARTNYLDFQKSFYMFVGYFLLCVYLPTGIVFLPISLIAAFFNRPKYVA